MLALRRLHKRGSYFFIYKDSSFVIGALLLIPLLFTAGVQPLDELKYEGICSFTFGWICHTLSRR